MEREEKKKEKEEKYQCGTSEGEWKVERGKWMWRGIQSDQYTAMFL